MLPAESCWCLLTPSDLFWPLRPAIGAIKLLNKLSTSEEAIGGFSLLEDDAVDVAYLDPIRVRGLTVSCSKH